MSIPLMGFIDNGIVLYSFSNKSNTSASMFLPVLTDLIVPSDTLHRSIKLTISAPSAAVATLVISHSTARFYLC